jgi:hypothetical protein
MRRYLVHVSVIWCAAAALVSLSLIAGRGNSITATMQRLHLADCAPPCWIGIVPGRMSFAEAYQRFVDVFGMQVSPINAGDAEFRRLMDSNSISRMLPDTASPSHKPTIVTFYVSQNRTVERVSLSTENGAGDLPRLGDLVSMIGPPQCIQVVGNYYMLVFSASTGIIAIQLDQSMPPQWNRPIQYLHFMRVNTADSTYDICTGAQLPLVPWRGLAIPRKYR